MMPTSLRLIPILSSHLRLGLPTRIFTEINTVKTLLLSLILARSDAHRYLLDLINLNFPEILYYIMQMVQIVKILIVKLSHSPVSFFLGSNTRLWIFFPNTLILYSCIPPTFHGQALLTGNIIVESIRLELKPIETQDLPTDC